MIDININTDTSLNLTTDNYRVEAPYEMPKSTITSSEKK